MPSLRDFWMEIGSGDVTWGDPDTNLETGTTDIAYNGPEDCLYQHWFSWSDNSTQGGALDKTTEIRDVLFRRGAPPKYTISADTAANMQIALDALGTLEVEDWPLGIRVEQPTDGTNLTLTATNITFNSRTTAHVEWRGVGELTWIVSTGSDIEDARMYASKGGTITVQRPATLTVEGLINGSEVRVYDDDSAQQGNMGTELDGTESLSGTTFQYSHDGTANDVIVQMIADGYEEVLVPISLTNQDQTLVVETVAELNL